MEEINNEISQAISDTSLSRLSKDSVACYPLSQNKYNYKIGKNVFIYS